jgi:hypothetical protein
MRLDDDLIPTVHYCTRRYLHRGVWQVGILAPRAQLYLLGTARAWACLVSSYETEKLALIKLVSIDWCLEVCKGKARGISMQVCIPKTEPTSAMDVVTNAFE